MKHSSYLIYIILLIILISCVRKDTINKDDTIYYTSTKLSELTGIQFPKVVFVDGIESRYMGGNSKEYKLFIPSSKEKENLMEEIKKDLTSFNTKWSQSDTTFSFLSHSTRCEQRNEGIGNTTFMVNITIPKFSNDTIYEVEHMMDNTPKKIIE